MLSSLMPRNTLSSLIISAVIVLTLVILATKYYYLAFAPSCAAIALIIISRYPQVGIYALIFLIPFGAFRKFSISGIEINISWLIAIPLFIIILLQGLVSKSSLRQLVMPIWPWLALFFLILIISTGLSPYPATALKGFKLWLAALFFIILLKSLISERGFKQTLPSILITSVGLSAFLGNLGFFFSSPLLVSVQPDGSFSRNLGGSIDPNNLSLMVIACLPLIVYRFLYSPLRRAKLIYALLFLNCIIAVGTTYSRGGLLILIITSLLMVVEYRHFFRAKFIGFVLLGVTVSLVTFSAMMPDSFWTRQSSLVSWSDSSLVRRTAYLYVAADAFKDRPLVGYGPDSFYNIFAETSYARFDKETGKPQGRYAHNTYIEILIGTGIVGLLLFLIIIGKSLRSFSLIKREYLLRGSHEQACFIGSCRLFFLSVMVYLLIFSEPHHKFMLLGIVMSQLAIEYFTPEKKSPGKNVADG